MARLKRLDDWVDDNTGLLSWDPIWLTNLAFPLNLTVVFAGIPALAAALAGVVVGLDVSLRTCTLLTQDGCWRLPAQQSTHGGVLWGIAATIVIGIGLAAVTRLFNPHLFVRRGAHSTET